MLPVWVAPILAIFSGSLCIYNALTVRDLFAFMYFKVGLIIMSLPYIFYGSISIVLANHSTEFRQIWVRPAQAFAFLAFLSWQVFVYLHNRRVVRRLSLDN